MFRSLSGTGCGYQPIGNNQLLSDDTDMVFLLFIFNKSRFLNVKNGCICQFLVFDRRNESDLRGDDAWRKL